MRRAALLVIACLFATGLAAGLPGRALACSCMPQLSFPEAVAQSPDLVVFVGTVTALQADPSTGGGLATIAVEGTFRGPALPPAILARSGNGADCGLPMTVGERRLFTARVNEQGAWAPGICDPQALLGTPDGDALLADAEAAFGPLQPTASAPPLANPGGEPAGPDAVAIAAVAAIALALALLIVVAVSAAARRRGSGPA